ncbi:unnamed protein product [Pleuronectes platessa]|uniref:Uncharacterized protein n=1 Tax=Pleuronectes platessa TaxID=8262 RepID=A0A9N7VV36_PLEPL|nr:unnamed protein product [Pleuronectes platessa]
MHVMSDGPMHAGGGEEKEEEGERGGGGDPRVGCKLTPSRHRAAAEPCARCRALRGGHMETQRAALCAGAFQHILQESGKKKRKKHPPKKREERKKNIAAKST